MFSVTRIAQDSARHIAAYARRSWHGLTAPRDSVSWKVLFDRAISLRRPNSYGFCFLTALAIVVALVAVIVPIWQWYAEERVIGDTVTYPHAALVNPLIAGIGAALLIYAAIRQAWTANRQANIASQRHEAQTKADQQRRITDTFSKAVEQLASDKMEVRLGGIYTLERLAGEAPATPNGADRTAKEGSGPAPDLYWTVLENLTAFVRERTQRTEVERALKPPGKRIAERAYSLWENAGQPDGRSEEFWREAVDQETQGEPPATDIAAVLTVIRGRSEEHRAEETKDWRVIDFRQVGLRRANLREAHLERADLREAHLEGADLYGAHLKHANLDRAHFERAQLGGAHLQHTRTLWGAFRRRLPPRRAFRGRLPRRGTFRRRKPRLCRRAFPSSNRAGLWRYQDHASQAPVPTGALEIGQGWRRGVCRNKGDAHIAGCGAMSRMPSPARRRARVLRARLTGRLR